MNAPPLPQVDARLYATFCRILSTRRVRSSLTVDSVREELTAAQIPPATYGAYFKAACHAGLLRHTGRYVPCATDTSRGRRVALYVVQPRTAAASALTTPVRVA